MADYVPVGKTLATLSRPGEIPGRDAFIANDDQPKLELSSASIQRALWVGVSIRSAQLTKCDLSHTTFVDCYFRGASFVDCNFTGTRFVDCNFRSAVFRGCQLRYSRWNRTEIRRATLLGNLPSEANLAQEVLIQLRLNASSIGEFDDARYFLYEAEKRSREHYREVIWSRSHYYRTKYRFADRVWAALRYVRSQIDHWLWGYGERPFRLSINGLALVGVVGVANALASDSVGIWDGFKRSLATFVPGFGVADATFWDLAASLVGVVYIAFLAASLHRRVSTRRD